MVSLVQANPEFKKRVQEEMNTISSLIDKIEEEDFEASMEELEERRNDLMLEYSQDMLTSPATMLGGDEKAAEKAHQNYLKALVSFYDELPSNDGQDYWKEVKALAAALAKANEAYVKAGGKKLEYMDYATYIHYYTEQYNKANPPKKDEDKKKDDEKKDDGKKDEDPAPSDDKYMNLDAAQPPKAWAEL